MIDYIIKFLKGELIKLALIKLVKSGPFLGFRTWLVKFVVSEFFEEIAEPIIKLGIRKANYTYNKVQGNILIEKIKEDIQNGNQTSYDNHVDDIFN